LAQLEKLAATEPREDQRGWSRSCAWSTTGIRRGGPSCASYVMPRSTNAHMRIQTRSYRS
jgi:hypothetical protein